MKSLILLLVRKAASFCTIPAFRQNSFHSHPIKKSRFRLMPLSTALLLLAVFLGFSACKKDATKSNLAGLTSFSINNINLPFTIDEAKMEIQNADSLPYQTDVSAMVATFTAVPNANVAVNGTPQVSGSTVNNFNTPITYVVTAEDGTTKRNYTVRVNVALIDPNTVAWNQTAANGGFGDQYSVSGAFYNNKYWFSGKTLNQDWVVYSSADGIAWTKTTTMAEANDYNTPGVESSLLNFKNKLWVLGGHVGGFGGVTNNVWSSGDGVTWNISSQAGPGTRWSGRQRIPAIAYKDELWVVGGSGFPSFNDLRSSGMAYKDIWKSADGTTWNSVQADPAFTARSSPAIFVHKNKLFIAGGRTGTTKANGTYLNDIWSTEDGVTWTELNVTSKFDARWGHQIVTYNNELFLIGGETADGIQKDLWTSSDDGVSWTKVAANNPRALPANFTTRAFFKAFVNDNTIWILGGRGGLEEPFNSYKDFRNDVWKGKLVK